MLNRTKLTVVNNIRK